MSVLKFGRKLEDIVKTDMPDDPGYFKEKPVVRHPQENIYFESEVLRMRVAAGFWGWVIGMVIGILVGITLAN